MAVVTAPINTEQKPRFYPNKSQWMVIWIVAVIVCLGMFNIFEQAAFVIDAVIIGGLLVWKFSKNSN